MLPMDSPGAPTARSAKPSLLKSALRSACRLSADASAVRVEATAKPLVPDEMPIATTMVNATTKRRSYLSVVRTHPPTHNEVSDETLEKGRTKRTTRTCTRPCHCEGPGQRCRDRSGNSDAPLVECRLDHNGRDPSHSGRSWNSCRRRQEERLHSVWIFKEQAVSPDPLCVPLWRLPPRPAKSG
jgi:hypothetical protein